VLRERATRIVLQGSPILIHRFGTWRDDMFCHTGSGGGARSAAPGGQQMCAHGSVTSVGEAEAPVDVYTRTEAKGSDVAGVPTSGKTTERGEAAERTEDGVGQHRRKESVPAGKDLANNPKHYRTMFSPHTGRGRKNVVLDKTTIHQNENSGAALFDHIFRKDRVRNASDGSIALRMS